MLISMVCFQLEPPRLHWPHGLELLVFRDRSTPVNLPRNPRPAFNFEALSASSPRTATEIWAQDQRRK